MAPVTPLPYTVELPLPNPVLSPNGSRGHWAKHARAVHDYRFCCYLLARAATPPPWPFYFARISLRFRFCAGRRAWDADNCLASAKPLIDGLRDANVLRSDGARHVTYGAVESVHCRRGCRCGGGVEITIEEAKA